MLLIDLICEVSASSNVNVYSAFTQKLLSYYDGKNSIDNKYNNSEIGLISSGKNSIDVYIKEWK